MLAAEVEIVENGTTSHQIIENYNDTKDFESIRNYIKNCIDDMQRNFLKLGYLFDFVKTNKYYVQLEYESFEDFVLGEYGFTRQTANRFIAIFHRFAKPIEVNKKIDIYAVSLKDDFKDYNVSQLIELVNVPEEEISKFKPSMKVKDIRENKAAIKAKNELDSQLDNSNPRSAFSRLINDLCNSTSYKYPGCKEPVVLNLASIKNNDSYSYNYKEFVLVASLDILKMKIKASVSSKGDIHFEEPFYMNIALEEYIDCTTPKIKKEFTTKLNEELVDYYESLEEKNKAAEEKAKQKMLEAKVLDNYLPLSMLNIFLKDPDYKSVFYKFYNLDSINLIVKHILSFIPNGSFIIDSKKQVLNIKDGFLFNKLNFDGLTIDNVCYCMHFNFYLNSWSDSIDVKLTYKNKDMGNYPVNYKLLLGYVLLYSNKFTFYEIVGILALEKIPKEKLCEEHINYLEENELFSE